MYFHDSIDDVFPVIFRCLNVVQYLFWIVGISYYIYIYIYIYTYQNYIAPLPYGNLALENHNFSRQIIELNASFSTISHQSPIYFPLHIYIY